MKKKFVKICSQCGSESFKGPITPWKAFVAPISGEEKCLDCGFEGIPIEVEEKSLEKIRAHIKKGAKKKRFD